MDYIVRTACECDLPAINALCEAEGLELVEDLAGVWVADAEDGILGFVRMTPGCNGYMHINPIATNPEIRHAGVGRTLISTMLNEYGEVRLIARGESKGFYHKLGAQDIDWSEVDTSAGHDCTGCPIIDECVPTPMTISSELFR